MEQERIKYCPECQVGIPHFGFATYFTWIEDELITVPDFPCWICDVCGRREWDSHSLMQLNLLLSPNAGKLLQKRRPITSDRDLPIRKTTRKTLH